MFRRRNYQAGAYGTAYTQAVQSQAAQSGAQPTSSPVVQNVLPTPAPSQPVSGQGSFPAYVQSGNWQNVGSDIKAGIVNFGTSLLSALSDPNVLGASQGVGDLVSQAGVGRGVPNINAQAATALESDVEKINEQLENERAILRAKQEEDPTGESDYLAQNPLEEEMPHTYRANVQEGGRIGYAEGKTADLEKLQKAAKAYKWGRALSGDPTAIASLIGGKVQANKAKYPGMTFKERQEAKRADAEATGEDVGENPLADEMPHVYRKGSKEGGLMTREGYAVGGIASRLARKLLNKVLDYDVALMKTTDKAEINKLLKQAYKEDPEVSSDIINIRSRIEDIDNELGGIGSENVQFEREYISELGEQREYLIRGLKQIEETGEPVLYIRDEGEDFFENLIERPRSPGQGPTGRPQDPWGGGRVGYQEGGEIDEQMTALMGEEEAMPAETMLPDEQPPALRGETEQMPAETMLPDEEMEEGFVDYVVESSLSPEDTNYLEEALAADDRLSMIFDQVVETASEFSGSGPVEGPGTEVSDSIPARLSDGEFVMTAKAADQIGPDNLQGMMEQAEMDADDVVRREMAVGGAFIAEDVDEDVVLPQQGVLDASKREMLKLQLSANPRTQYRTVYG